MTIIKRMVTEAPMLAFYDPAKEPVVESDASQKGLVAVLMRKDDLSHMLVEHGPRQKRGTHKLRRIHFQLYFRWTRSTSMCLPVRRPSSTTTNQLKLL